MTLMQHFNLINQSIGVADSSFMFIPASATTQVVAKSKARNIPWYHPDVIKNGGFFYKITKEQFEANKGRLTTPPPAKAAQHGVRYRSEKRTYVDGTNVIYGHYYHCDLLTSL